MQSALQLTFRDVPHSDAIEASVREKVLKLEAMFPPLVSCHVSVELPHKHKHQGKQFCVHITLHVPGAELVVSHHPATDCYSAVSEAFAVAKRRLDAYARRLRGDKKHYTHLGRAEVLAPAEPAAAAAAAP
jgi:ribosomal subunit interface protein